MPLNSGAYVRNTIYTCMKFKKKRKKLKIGSKNHGYNKEGSGVDLDDLEGLLRGSHAWVQLESWMGAGVVSLESGCRTHRCVCVIVWVL